MSLQNLEQTPFSLFHGHLFDVQSNVTQIVILYDTCNKNRNKKHHFCGTGFIRDRFIRIAQLVRNTFIRNVVHWGQFLIDMLRYSLKLAGIQLKLVKLPLTVVSHTHFQGGYAKSLLARVPQGTLIVLHQLAFLKILLYVFGFLIVFLIYPCDNNFCKYPKYFRG